MPTRYDVFAKLIEKSPCKESELDFKTEVYTQLKELSRLGWVRVQNNIYSPIKNNKTTYAFKIIKYCLKNNLDYNLFFSRNMIKILTGLVNNVPNLRPENLKGNKDILNILKYLETHQFILIHKKRPAKGLILRHELFKDIFQLYDNKIIISKPNFKNQEVKVKVKKLKGKPINPFDETIFSFLAGSAQLEGATLSEGETRELLLNDVYPEKPQKDIQMVKNLNEALHYILEHLDEDITEEHIKQINYLVLFSLHRNGENIKQLKIRFKGIQISKQPLPTW